MARQVKITIKGAPKKGRVIIKKVKPASYKGRSKGGRFS